MFQQYLAGQIATSQEFALLWAPTVNSYKRFQPNSWAPTGIAWGVDNRTLGYRVVGHAERTRVECRIPGSDANSYLAFAGTLAGGLYGIRHQLTLPEPYIGNGPSQAAQEADSFLYNALWTGYTAEVEKARKLPAGAIAKGIDELPQRMAAANGNAAKVALDWKLIDGVKTRDEVRDLFVKRGAYDDRIKSFRQVSFGDYVTRNHRIVRLGASKAERRAVRFYRQAFVNDATTLAEKTGLSEGRAQALLPLLAGPDAPLDASPHGDGPADGAPSPDLCHIDHRVGGGRDGAQPSSGTASRRRSSSCSG